MKILAYLWKAVINLIILGIVAAMLHVANTPFETVVIASLVLVYEAVVWNAIVLSRQALALDGRNYSRFLELRTAVARPSESHELEELKELNKRLEDPSFWINAAGTSLVSLLATWEIVSTVL